jgi:cobalt-zinc-cadmium resistance protein CzcA
MLSHIIEFSVKNKLIIGLLTLTLVLVGAYQTTQLPIDAVPDITNNQVQIITIAPSYGASDIERLVTFPIEQATSNISGIKEIRSFSRFGLSLVTIVFTDATDVFWARQQVSEKLIQVQSQIPSYIGTPELGPITTGLGEIYQYVLKPKIGFEKKFDAIELRTIQDWIVRRQLLGVKGVAEVSSFGGKLKQFEIAVNPNKLHAYGITINEIFDALESNNQNTGGGYIEKGPTVLYIRTEGLVGNIEDIKNISIASSKNQTPLFIRDIAEVRITYATRYGAICYNDNGEVAGGVVMMLKGENSSNVVKLVKSKVEQIKSTLPEGVELEPYLDRTKMVDHAIGTVETNLLEGALIVVFVLVLFLGNFRAGLLVSSVIPLSLLFAISMMNLFGVSGNLMSLGALDFGLIVDGAVIIVEAVMHQLSHNLRYRNLKKLRTHEMDEEVTSSAGKMMSSAVFGQLIILIVYLPIFSLQGIEGKMFRPMAQTVAFALLGAFILSLTYIPMMSAWFLSKKVKHEKNFSDKMMNRIENYYQTALVKILRYPKIVLSAVLVMFLFSVFLMSQLGGEFIPELEEGDFAVDTRVLTGSNLNTTIEFTQKAAHILKTRFPEVIKVVTKIGSGEVPTDPMPMEASDMMVVLKDKSEWTSATTFSELSEKMSVALEDVPGITTGFQFPVQMRFNELMTGARQDVVCKIFGENLDSLAAYAARLGKVISTINGTENLYVEPVTGLPQVVIEYDRKAIAQHHLSIADINKIVNASLAGQAAGQVFEEERRFDLVVRVNESERDNVYDIGNLLIPCPDGMHIPLSQLANVVLKDGPNQIQREDAKRRIIVGFNIKDRDVQSIVEQLQSKVNAQLKFPSGYYVNYGGAFENLNQAKSRLMIAVPVALLLIFLLLFFAFNSVKQGLLIYSAIPLSAIGGIFFLALRGMPFSISAGIGFIALFGVAVLNGIVLIAEFNRLKSCGMKNNLQVVITGAKLRLRPVLMTALVASLGFLPMALSNGAGAEVQRPLATVVIGGLLIATFLTLFVLPLLFVLAESGFFALKSTRKTSILLIPFLALASHTAIAQQKLSLEEAINIGLKNNLQLQTENLKAEYAKVATKAAFDLPKTNLTAEYGQINSAYIDAKIGISQSFAFPAVYSNTRKYLKDQLNTAFLNYQNHEFDLKRVITENFFEVIILREKEKLLLIADSLYANFNAKAALRFSKGESNILEKATAETQRTNIAVQLNLLQKDIQMLMAELKYLLNMKEEFQLNVSSLKYQNQTNVDTNLICQNPFAKWLESKYLASKTQAQLQRSMLLPDLTMGYYNVSFKGIGADNHIYSTANRFNSIQLGIAVPFYSKALRTNIALTKTNSDIAKKELQVNLSALKNKYEQLTNAIRKDEEVIRYFESTELGNSEEIYVAANKQFILGEINYLEYVMLINQVIEIKSHFLDAIQNLNADKISINYLKY